MADSPQRFAWSLTCDFYGTPQEASDFFDWLHEECPFVPNGPGTFGLDGSSMTLERGQEDE